MRSITAWSSIRALGSRNGGGSREIVLLEVQARLLRLAIELKTEGRRRVTETVATPPAGGVGLFERILKIVSERYQQPLSIPDIARELKVSRVHVMRQFRKVTGMSVLDYITQQRVSCAQRLLATTDMKLLDIAAEAGFRSTARFYPCFKRLVGESPARYRRSLHIMPAKGVEAKGVVFRQ